MSTVFLTDTQLEQALVDNLGIDLSTAPTRWARIVSNANLSAYYDIRGALLQRGFQASQVDGWDRGAEFNLAIGIYWSLVNGAGLHSYDDKFIKLQDRRAELMYVLVENTGTPAPPSGSPPGVGNGAVVPVHPLYEAWRLRQFAGEGTCVGGYLYGGFPGCYGGCDFGLIGGPWNGNFQTGILLQNGG